MYWFVFVSHFRPGKENRSLLAAWLLLFLWVSACVGCQSSKVLSYMFESLPLERHYLHHAHFISYIYIFCCFQALPAPNYLSTSKPSSLILHLPSPWCLDWVSCGLDWRQLVPCRDSWSGSSWEWPSSLWEMSTKLLHVVQLMTVLRLLKCISCIMVRIY